MGTIRTFAALIAVSTATLLATAPAEAAVTPGARYDAVAGKPRVRQFATVSADGKRIKRYYVALDGTCSDGEEWHSGLLDFREPRTLVRADGSFANPPTSIRGALDRGRKEYAGSIAIGFAGTSTPDATRLAIKVTGRFTGKGLRCRGTGSVTLVRAGVAGAPAANPRLLNGTYRGVKSGGVGISKFSMLSAAGEFDRLRVSYRMKCRRRDPIADGFTFKPQLLTLRDTFSLATTTSGKVRKTRSLRYTLRERFSLAFFRKGAAHGYRGTYRASVTYTRNGKPYDRCSLPTTRFEQTTPGA